MVGEEKGGLPNERDVDNHIVVELKGGDPILRQVWTAWQAAEIFYLNPAAFSSLQETPHGIASHESS